MCAVGLFEGIFDLGQRHLMVRTELAYVILEIDDDMSVSASSPNPPVKCPS